MTAVADPDHTVMTRDTPALGFNGIKTKRLEGVWIELEDDFRSPGQQQQPAVDKTQTLSEKS